MSDETKPLKLNLGCGKNRMDGYVNVDARALPSVDTVCDLRERMPWDDDSVDEVYSSHFLEHLTGSERVGFFNELYRVMKPLAKATIIVPYWKSGRAYGDPTHQWPPVVEFAFYYLNKEWRDVNGDHTGYTCDFDYSGGYTLLPGSEWSLKTQAVQQFAINHYCEVAQDAIITVTKREAKK